MYGSTSPAVTAGAYRQERIRLQQPSQWTWRESCSLITTPVARRLTAGEALDQVRREELSKLTDAEALAAVEELLDLLRFLPPRQGQSGLVEQQRIFARARA